MVLILCCLITTELTRPPRISFPQMMKGCCFWQASSCLLALHQPHPQLPSKLLPHFFCLMSQLESLPYPQFCCNSSTFSGAESCSGKNILKVGQAKNSNKCGRQHISGSFSKYHNINSTYSPFNLAIPLLRSSPMHRSQMFI